MAEIRDVYNKMRIKAERWCVENLYIPVNIIRPFVSAFPAPMENC